MLQIGPRIMALRTTRGLTQAELAQRTGLDQAVISRLERGQRSNPTINTLAAIATALDVPVTALVEDAAQPAA